MNDSEGPSGEIFGSALAHAETNVLARLPFRSRRDLVLTTTLQLCLQCAGAIRLGPITIVRFAGPDRYWDGCHDFGRLSAREARRTQPAQAALDCNGGRLLSMHIDTSRPCSELRAHAGSRQR